MDQTLIDSAEKRLRMINRREVTLTKSYFAQLVSNVNHCLVALGQFNPTHVQPMELRSKYKGMYQWMANQLSDIFEFPIDAELLSGLSIDSIDFAEGVIKVKVTHTYNRKIRQFVVTFNDELAPHSTVWGPLLTKHGGAGARFSQLIGLV